MPTDSNPGIHGSSGAKRKSLDGLNEDLCGEFPALIMYRLFASTVQGPYRQELRAFFTNEIPEELMHPQNLADKISAMGGTPAAAAGDWRPAGDSRNVGHPLTGVFP